MKRLTRGRGASSLRGVVRVPYDCACVEPGAFNSGVGGVLAGIPFDNGVRYIERCDACETFDSDIAACQAFAREHGGSCFNDLDLRAIWVPL